MSQKLPKMTQNAYYVTVLDSIQHYSTWKNVYVSYKKWIGWPVLNWLMYQIAKQITNIFEYIFQSNNLPKLTLSLHHTNEWPLSWRRPRRSIFPWKKQPMDVSMRKERLATSQLGQTSSRMENKMLGMWHTRSGLDHRHRLHVPNFWRKFHPCILRNTMFPLPDIRKNIYCFIWT